MVQVLLLGVPARFERIREFLAGLKNGLGAVPAVTRRVMFGWSIAYQVVAGLFFEAAAAPWALGPPLHQAVWIGIPVALAATVLPVSIGGLGLRESLFAMVFTSVGLRAEHGLALGLMWGAQGLVSAAIGAVLQSVRSSDEQPY